MLEAALEHTKGHKQDAAKVLGWGRNTLTQKTQRAVLILKRPNKFDTLVIKHAHNMLSLDSQIVSTITVRLHPKYGSTNV